VRLLGPVTAHIGSREIDLGPARSRTLFAMLATSAGQVVSREEIVDGLWGDSPPGNPSSSIYTYVNGLRRALEPQRDLRSSTSVLESVPPGYRLAADRTTVDTTRFTSHLNTGRRLLTADPRAAVAEFTLALGLWHGDPLTGTSGPFSQVTRQRLLEQRFSLIEDRATALLTLGHHDAVIGQLLDLTRQYPLREQPRGLLMQALHRNGNTDEALAAFADIQTILNTEFGIDPSPLLYQLRDRITAGAAELLTGQPQRTVITTPAPQAGPAVPAQLPRVEPAFVGRRSELARLRTLLAPAIRGVPMIGVVSGPAGVGKTRTRRAFPRWAALRQPAGLRPPRTTGRPGPDNRHPAR
jgi:DNA-binding SARP family transcriptional activator